MGMIGCLAAFDPATIDALRERPAAIEAHLYPQEGEGEPEHYVDLDKAWHAIDWLLTGRDEATAGALAWAVLGGEELGTDLGYGPPRLLLPAQVEQVADALEALGVDGLRARYDAAAMAAADVYPALLWKRDDARGLDYVAEYFAELVDFYARAARRGDGVFLWIA